MSDHKLDDKNRDFIPFDPSIISEIMDALDSSEKQKVIAITKDLSAIINSFDTYGLLEAVEQVNDQVREDRDWEHMVGRAVLEEED